MTTFLLVHGAWHGGWCYQRVARLLQAQGHIVYTPTLTGVGERSHLYHPDINLDTHIQDILNVIHWEGLDNFVLVGHSYGGMVVTGVADAVPEKILRLVYLDAFVPQDGRSLFDHMPPERPAQNREAAAASGNNSVSPVPAAWFEVNPADVVWVDSLCVPQALGTFSQPIDLSGGLAKLTTQRVYIFAEKGAEKRVFSQFYDEFKGDLTWITYTLSGGHDLMVDQPEELAEILIEVR